MRHRLSRRKLNRPTAHRTLLLRNLVSDVFRYGSIQTTEPKAKEVKRVTEKIITRAKSGTLHDRRQVLSLITDHKLVKKVLPKQLQLSAHIDFPFGTNTDSIRRDMIKFDID